MSFASAIFLLAAATDDAVLQRRQFRAVRELLDQLNRRNFQLDTLSMGMSNDLEAAIA